jgi:hypothetical protein
MAYAGAGVLLLHVLRAHLGKAHEAQPKYSTRITRTGFLILHMSLRLLLVLHTCSQVERALGEAMESWVDFDAFKLADLTQVRR